MPSTSGACDISCTSHSQHVTDQEVRYRPGQPPVTSLVKSRRIKLFGHIAGTEPAQDHVSTLRASVSHLSEDWRRTRGRPHQSWLRTVEADLKPLNFGLHTACRRAADRSAGGVWWKQLSPWMGAPPHDDDDDDDETDYMWVIDSNECCIVNVFNRTVYHHHHHQ